MRISDYLDSRLITFLQSSTRDEAIDQLVDLLDEEGVLAEKDIFRQAIFSREQIVSTGIGMGVAVPHAKLKELPQFFLAIGIQQKRGLDWNALDKTPVRLVFMIGGPENRQTEYLQILSLLTSAVRDADLRKQLLNVQTAEEVVDLLSNF
jgi:PTS system nitrogen regulatory IIA component